MAFQKKHAIRNLESADAAQDIDDNFDAVFATLRALDKRIGSNTVVIEKLPNPFPPLGGGSNLPGPPGEDGAAGDAGPPGPPGARGLNGPVVPYYIAPTETFSVPEFQQALFAMNIDNEGILDVEGFLIEVT